VAKKTYTVIFKAPESSLESVEASNHEIVDGYLILTSENGDLRGMFLLDVVENWSIDAAPN
jgi:hypothetical protein